MTHNGILFKINEKLYGSTYNGIVSSAICWKESGRWVIPDFQRPLVWTTEQKILFIESMVGRLPIGEYTVHRTKDSKYEVLDGQQRWNAIFSYMADEFPVNGYLWSELNDRSKAHFEDSPFAYRLVERLTEEEKIDVYNRLAYGGTPHEPITKP